MNILSQIKILSSEQILMFEQDDENTFGAVNIPNISEINLIQHPFLVSWLYDDIYLLIENTGEYLSLMKAGLSHFPVQLCPFDQLKLKSDKLGIVDFNREDLMRLSAKHPQQIIVGEANIKKEEQFFHIRLEFDFGQEGICPVWLRDSTKVGCPAPLDLMFRTILQKGRYLPIIEKYRNPSAVTKTVTYNAILTLPSFSFEDIKRSAESDRLFPPGIVHFQPQTRILNIDFPMSVLGSDIPMDEKETFLKELVVLRERANKTSYYEGNIYLLNL